jgi:trans-2-enoyl-CoA reductase
MNEVLAIEIQHQNDNLYDRIINGNCFKLMDYLMFNSNEKHSEGFTPHN